MRQRTDFVLKSDLSVCANSRASANPATAARASSSKADAGQCAGAKCEKFVCCEEVESRALRRPVHALRRLGTCSES